MSICDETQIGLRFSLAFLSQLSNIQRNPALVKIRQGLRQATPFFEEFAHLKSVEDCIAILVDVLEHWVRRSPNGNQSLITVSKAFGTICSSFLL